jgi:hypothetical protein
LKNIFFINWALPYFVRPKELIKKRISVRPSST